MGPEADTALCPLWIVGYGNPQRGDDGTGCYVAARLERFLEGKEGISVRAVHQLDPCLVEEVEGARTLILVDVTVEELEGGTAWDRVEPQPEAAPFVTHDVGPSYLLALIQQIYRRCPKTWLVSIQGEDFGFGEGLSVQVEERAERAVAEILSFVSRK